MSLLVVTPFCSKDWKSAVRLYEWIHTLGDIKNNDVLLVHNKSEQRIILNRVLLSAKRVAKSVTLLAMPDPIKPDWPIPQNEAFGSASKYVYDNKLGPFLWLETDAVPIRIGWLTDLEKEYETCGKRYMGGVVHCKPSKNVKVLFGTAVYNPSVWELFYNINSKDIAFDVAMSADTVPLSHSSKLFQFEDVSKWTDLSKLNHAVSVLHKDKAGFVIEHLGLQQKFSIVITSHNRMDRLKRAYQSCVSAGVSDIVITATGYKEQEWNDNEAQFECTKVLNDTDNSNSAWIAGVNEAKNEWVTLLHDDDMLLPNFASEVRKHIGQNFVVWPARFHHDDQTRTDLCAGPFEGTGHLSTSVLLDAVTKQNSFSITPCRGMFKKQDLIKWLTEAGTKLGLECYYRPNFLVGNDLWIYLRAGNTYRNFYNLEVPIVSLGADSDSCTMDALANDQSKLVRIYNSSRNIFAIVIKNDVPALPVHIVTIVLDGAPFLLGQLQVFNRLKCNWHWTIVEGTAEPTHCTSWCKGIESRLSVDGTSSILDDLSQHKRITVIRKQSWDGKVDMVNAALANRNQEEVLIQVDVDEFWEAWQIDKIAMLLQERTECSHAMFWCRYFVGPGIVMEDHNCFANNPNQEWRRAWRRKQDQKFISHEPPVMSGDQTTFLNHSETEALGLVFDHYSYVLKSQVAFKETYYGYANATRHWNKLQKTENGRLLNWSFPWAINSGTVHTL